MKSRIPDSVLMVGGMGYDLTDPKVATECAWLETVK